MFIIISQNMITVYVLIYILNAMIFSIFLKLKKAFLEVLPKSGLFSIAHCLYGWQKIVMNKHVFSCDLHFLFITFFSLKCIIKTIYFPLSIPLNLNKILQLSSPIYCIYCTAFYNEMVSRGIHNFCCSEIRIILVLLTKCTSS